MTSQVTSWLTDKFLEWQGQTRKRQTVTAFAKHLGVSRDVLNQWMNGKRTPSEESAELLAAKLGPEIYDAIGIPRPDPIQKLIIRLWGRLTDDEVRAIERIAREAEERGARDVPKSAPKPKRASSNS